VISKFALLLDPVATLPESRFLESHTKVMAVRMYCLGELNVSVKEADSVPDLEGGITAQSAVLAYFVSVMG
jgi:hypothetical protein